MYIGDKTMYQTIFWEITCYDFLLPFLIKLRLLLSQIALNYVLGYKI